MLIDDGICENCLAKNHCDVLPYSNNCNEVRAMAKHDKQVYNKAIDDFAILMKEAFNHDWATTKISEQIIYSRLFDKCNEIAEQLKEGVKNE